MRCYYCMKPADAGGNIFHHRNCAGLEDAGLNSLQRHHLEAQLSATQALLAEARGMLASCADSLEDEGLVSHPATIRAFLAKTAPGVDSSQDDAGVEQGK